MALTVFIIFGIFLFVGFPIVSLYDNYRSKITIFLSLDSVVQYIQILWDFLCISCGFDHFIGVYCRFPYLNRLLAGCAGELSPEYLFQSSLR